MFDTVIIVLENSYQQDLQAKYYFKKMTIKTIWKVVVEEVITVDNKKRF